MTHYTRDNQGRLMMPYETGEGRARVASHLSLCAGYRRMNNLPLARKYVNLARTNNSFVRTGPAQ